MTTFIFQHQADTEKGFQVREQVRQAAEEGGRVQPALPAQERQEEGVHHGRRPRAPGAQEARLGTRRKGGKVKVRVGATAGSG